MYWLCHCVTTPLRYCALHHCATAPLHHCATAPLRLCATAPWRHCAICHGTKLTAHFLMEALSVYINANNLKNVYKRSSKTSKYWLCHCVIIPLCYCTPAPLHHCATAPLRHCATATLRYCTTVLLHRGATAPKSLKSIRGPAFYLCHSAPSAAARQAARMWQSAVTEKAAWFSKSNGHHCAAKKMQELLQEQTRFKFFRFSRDPDR